MRIRNPGTTIENIPYEIREGHDPQPIEVHPGQTVTLSDTHFDAKGVGTRNAFIRLLQTGRLELVEAPASPEVK